MSERREKFEILIHATPEQLWNYLTTAEGLAAWLGTTATVDLRIGGERNVGWGTDEQIESEFAEIEPNSRVRVVYRVDGVPLGAEEWLLTAQGSSTRLTLIHSMPDDDVEDWEGFYGDMRRGWQLFMASLRHIVENGDTPLRTATTRYIPIDDRQATWHRARSVADDSPDLMTGMALLVTDKPHSLLYASSDRSLLIDMEGARPNMVMFLQASTHGADDTWRDEILDRMDPAASP